MSLLDTLRAWFAAPPPAAIRFPALTPPPHPRPPQAGMQTAGRLWRWEAGTWAQVTDENDDPVQEIWSSPGETEVVVATWGPVLRRVGGEWRREKVPLRRSSGVWGDGAGKVYLCGGGGILASREGGPWARELETPNAGIAAVRGRSPTDLWAIASNGELWRSAGDGAWLPGPRLTSALLLALEGDGVDLWAVGNDGVVLRGTPDGVWALENVGEAVQLSSVYCAQGRVHAIGTNWYERADGAWRKVAVPTDRQLVGVGGFGDEVVAVGLGGTVVSRVGDVATLVASTFRGELGVVHGARPGVWYVGGEQFYME